MKGVGDLMAKITSFTGMDTVVKSVLGEDCGCDERQELMNEMLPFSKDSKELEVDKDVLYSKALSLAFVKDIIKHRETGKRINKEQFGLIWDIYRFYVNPRKTNTQCVKCVNTSLDELHRALSK